ncbi:MAG: hypothetical protein SV775_11770 [Thermodesulfobacteriota bacterium]|nr:hypothetical protein [Thermodesulfobacteriota bacterium]
MFVPFWALSTHLPDDQAVDQPMTLLPGEFNEKAVLVGYENAVFSASGYVFNGYVERPGEEKIEIYGSDLSYATSEESDVELLVGASCISNRDD